MGSYNRGRVNYHFLESMHPSIRGNSDFVDVIIPTLADMDETVTDKIAELEIFINVFAIYLLTC